MSEQLSGEELTALVQRVFQPGRAERKLAIIVDLPDESTPDTPEWQVRRQMALGWLEQLQLLKDDNGLEVTLLLYRNVRMNNADLPEMAYPHDPGAPLPSTAEELDPAGALPFADLLGQQALVLAPTQFSATAPLKLTALELGFRAATMPGFAPSMIPALRLDYTEINRRVWILKELLDEATGATLSFAVAGLGDRSLHLDLRFRTAHASGGLFPEPGTAGNLPSGETYIVPYEGERGDEPSRSEGVLPVQLDDEVVLFAVEQNRAVRVTGDGPIARAERERLQAEPAYGNMAELGLGVLAAFGLEPTGEILLDEKLGLHVAFGRSDHFGGQVGAADFSRPEAVVHIDRVYLPALQPRVKVVSVDLQLPGGDVALIRDDHYVVEF
jgi:hypothetical protein